MATTYLHSLSTIMAPLFSNIFLMPKVMMSGEISHSSYIVTGHARASYNFSIVLLQDYIQSLTHH